MTRHTDDAPRGYNRSGGGPVGTIRDVTAPGTTAGQQLLRVAAVMAVIFGVLLMHSAPLPGHGAQHPTVAEHPTPAAPDISAHAHAQPHGPVAVRGDVAAVLAGSGCDPDCTSHAGLHLCMAVVAIAAALVLARWSTLAAATAQTMPRRWAMLRRRAGRAPPWTIPTLAQLSVLRV
jgi:hypothetical protein